MSINEKAKKAADELFPPIGIPTVDQILEIKRHEFLKGWQMCFDEMCGEFWCEECCNKQDNCSHPRSERSYIGNNMLRCNLCGFEFS